MTGRAVVDGPPPSPRPSPPVGERGRTAPLLPAARGSRRCRGGRGGGGCPPDDPVLVAFLRDRPVLLAYGLLGDVTARLRDLGFDYMHAQQDWLRAQGARPRVVDCPTGAAVAANAQRVRAALRAADRPALILAHSKGGLEALEALLDPDAAARCAALVAFQSPFLGTPVADAVVARGVLHGPSRAALRLLGCGDGAGVRDLTTAARAAWMRAHGGAVAALLARLPVVAAGTTLDPGAPRGLGRDRAHGALVRAVARAAGPNDGLVPLASALLPGARHLVEPGGHVAMVAAGGGRNPVEALRRALGLALGTRPDAAERPAPQIARPREADRGAI